MQLQLGYPVKPATIIQEFGNDPAYYARFHDVYGNPEKGHMGIDFRAPHGTPVYAACDGLAYYMKDEHGGEGIHIRTDVFDHMDTRAFYVVINWHLCGDTDPQYPSPIALDGKQYPVKRGDLIGYADNTGAPFESSGDHLHFGLIPYNPDTHVPLNQDNGFNGCINPAAFFDDTYAQDTPRDEAYLMILLKAAWQVLAAKFPGRVAPPASTQ